MGHSERDQYNVVVHPDSSQGRSNKELSLLRSTQSLQCCATWDPRERSLGGCAPIEPSIHSGFDSHMTTSGFDSHMFTDRKLAISNYYL